jgi:hypothetical protein
MGFTKHADIPKKDAEVLSPDEQKQVQQKLARVRELNAKKLTESQHSE